MLYLRKCRLLYAFVAFLLVPDFVAAAPGDQQANTYIINTLGHLKDPTAPSPVPAPIPFREVDGKIRNSCTTPTGINSNNDLTDFLPVNANGGVLYPGAIVSAESLDSGALTQISDRRLPLNAATLTLNDVTVSVGRKVNTSQKIKKVDNWSVSSALTSLVSQNGLHFPNTSTFVHASSSNVEDAMLQVGLSAHWLTSSVDASLNQQHQASTSNEVVKYYQPFYVISMDYPEGVYQQKVTSTTLHDAEMSGVKPNLGVGNPPVFIKNVTFGRMLVMQITSSSDQHSLDVAVNAAYSGTGYGGSVNLTQQQRDLLTSSKYQVFAYGGDTQIAALVTRAPSFESVDKYLLNGASFSSTNPGAAISFRSQYFDGTAAKVGFTTNYTGATQCSPIVFKSPLHVLFHQTDDNKDSNIEASINVFAHNQSLGNWTGGRNDDWGDPGDIRVDLPFSGHLSMADCGSIQFQVGENHDDSGWHFDLTVTGDLADGSENGIVLEKGGAGGNSPGRNDWIIGNSGKPNSHQTSATKTANCGG